MNKSRGKKTNIAENATLTVLSYGLKEPRCVMLKGVFKSPCLRHVSPACL